MKKVITISVLAALAAVFVAGAAFAADTIGVISSQAVLLQHPKFDQTQKQLKSISDTKGKEAQTAIDKESDDKKKAQIFQSKRMELVQEEQKLMGPLLNEINVAIRTVANQKKLTVVVEKEIVFYGGVDITADVIAELKKK